MCDELKREELQFCCHTGAFSCSDAPPQPTATLPIGGSRFNRYVTIADMPETTRLRKTIDAWWPAIATFIRTRATNAKTEAANVTVKNIKRIGRGYRSHQNYRCRIMLYNAARMAA